LSWSAASGSTSATGAHVLSVPGHTDGSIAIHLPRHGVLFTGDAVAQRGRVPILGVFNVDRDRAAESLRRLAELQVKLACFGHTDPLRLAGAHDWLGDRR
jgi:glyoxylase-like metal-dependent hydrolase (beta-lactamase superfamily II)